MKYVDDRTKHVQRLTPASASVSNLDSSVALLKLLIHEHTSKSVEKEARTPNKRMHAYCTGMRL